MKGTAFQSWPLPHPHTTAFTAVLFSFLLSPEWLP